MNSSCPTCPVSIVERSPLIPDDPQQPPTMLQKYPPIPRGFKLLADGENQLTMTTTEDRGAPSTPSTAFVAMSFALGDIYCYSCIQYVIDSVIERLSEVAHSSDEDHAHLAQLLLSSSSSSVHGGVSVAATKADSSGSIDMLSVVLREVADPDRDDQQQKIQLRRWHVCRVILDCVVNKCGKQCVLLSRFPQPVIAEQQQAAPPLRAMVLKKEKKTETEPARDASDFFVETDDNIKSALMVQQHITQTKETKKTDAPSQEGGGEKQVMNCVSSQKKMNSNTSSSVAFFPQAKQRNPVMPHEQAQDEKKEELEFVIEGMSCTSCSSKIQSTLERAPGIERAVVSFATCSGSVVPRRGEDPQRIVDDVVAVVTKLGFKCTPPNLQPVSSRRRRPHHADDSSDSDSDDDHDHRTTALDIGGGGGVLDETDEATRRAIMREGEISTLTRATIIAVAGAGPLVLMMLLMIASDPNGRFMQTVHLPVFGSCTFEVLIGLVLSTPVVIVAGRPFFERAWIAFRNDFSMNMDTLVAVGVGVSYVSSVLVMVILCCTASSYGQQQQHTNTDTKNNNGGARWMHTNFDTAAVLLAFVCAGKLIEARAKRLTGDALLSLMQVVPNDAMLVRRGKKKKQHANNSNSRGGEEQRDQAEEEENPVVVPTRTLRPGDVVRVLPGCNIPVDGVVVVAAASSSACGGGGGGGGGRGGGAGGGSSVSSDVSEALVTGEPMPVRKTEGDVVVGGTQNLTNELLVRVTKVGKDTVVAHILKIVKSAQQSRPSLLRVTDRIASIFVPVVLILAMIVLCTWCVLGFFHLYPAEWRPAGVSPLSFAFSFSLATVVVACPCALGLAAPTAIMVGAGVGAQLGLLLKSAEAMERASSVDCVVFDKTGTLTTGRMSVSAVRCRRADGGRRSSGRGRVDGDDDDDDAAGFVLECVAAIESRSVHPIAKAICEYNNASKQKQRGPNTAATTATVEDWTQFPGRGVAATVALFGSSAAAHTSPATQNRHHVAVGSYDFLVEDEQCDADDDAAEAAGARRKHATTTHQSSSSSSSSAQQQQRHGEGKVTVVVCVAIDHKFTATIELTDETKADAHATVSFLRAPQQHGGFGCAEVWMVTGDQLAAATVVADEVGIKRKCVAAQVLPSEKVDIVKRLQDSGRRTVAFVGDGINDAAALAQANVGIAIGSGTDVAVDAADAVLVQERLFNVCTLLHLSRTTIRRIYINFAWACAYNAVMLPVSAGCFFWLLKRQLPPVVAGAAMMFSSLSVVCSSLLLRCYTPPKPYDVGTTSSSFTTAISSSITKSTRVTKFPKRNPKIICTSVVKKPDQQENVLVEEEQGSSMMQNVTAKDFAKNRSSSSADGRTMMMGHDFEFDERQGLLPHSS